jgi:hypothetical protein
MNNHTSFAAIESSSFEELQKKLQHAREKSWKHFGKTLKVYYPATTFPSISITGSYCEQNCLYCNKYYLQNMVSLTTPMKLKKYALHLASSQGKGMLISGGYIKAGIVPLRPFLKVIREIKEQTNLQINIHTGLVNEEQAQAIAEAKVDYVSFDFLTDNQVITEVIQNGKTKKDYIHSYESLLAAGLRVIPHICLGLYYGKIKGNIEAIETVLRYDPSLIVFLGLIPTKGSPMEDSPTIKPELFMKILLYTRLLRPEVEQSLGCMRVRTSAIEQFAVMTGINRIAVPKSKTINFAEETYGLEIKKLPYCCANKEREEKRDK